MAKAPDTLRKAAQHIQDRAALRDTPEGERSMGKAVAAFNVLYGHNLTETEGWLFMLLLKQARASGGAYHADDFEDMTAYSALAGESASAEASFDDAPLIKFEAEPHDISSILDRINRKKSEETI